MPSGSGGVVKEGEITREWAKVAGACMGVLIEGIQEGIRRH